MSGDTDVSCRQGTQGRAVDGGTRVYSVEVSCGSGGECRDKLWIAGIEGCRGEQRMVTWGGDTYGVRYSILMAPGQYSILQYSILHNTVVLGTL